jgi:hypothetical protein
MKSQLPKITWWALVALLTLTLVGCGAKHRLGEYTFRDLTAAALASAPGPEVFTGSFIDVVEDDLISTALRAGTTLAKEATASQAQARLDSAMIQVDVPERMKQRMLQRCSEFLHLRPTPDYEGCDFLFDMYIDSYGIDAESWESMVYFQIDLNVYLLDNRTGQEIWKTHLKRRQPLSRAIFSTGFSAADDVISAITMSQLTVEEMVTGFQYLADEAADLVVRKLRKDYAKSRESG